MLLGPLESEVMALAWQKGSVLVAELTEQINRRRATPLAYKTVLTICTRLAEKGLLAHTREGRAFRYAPTMSEAEFLEDQAAKAAAAMLDTFGSTAIAAFVDQVTASPGGFDALRTLVAKASKGP
jgi:predicted transcriptional regulator